MAEPLEDLLRACTVRVVGGPMPGAGFFVAPGLVLTCLHVIGDVDAAGLAVRWERDGHPPVELPVTGRLMMLANRGRPIPALDRDYPDIAVLEVSGLEGHPCVRLDPGWPAAEDRFQVFGYPREGGAVRLTPARLTYRGTHGNAPVAYLDLASDTVKPGMSGAAVLNLRTQSVCAVVVASKGQASPAGALAVPWSVIAGDLSDVLAASRDFHQLDRRWAVAAAADLEAAKAGPAGRQLRERALRRLVLPVAFLAAAAAVVVGVLITRTGPGADFRHSNGRRLQWSYSTGHVVDAGPAVADETVYVGSISAVYALNAATGHRRWSYPMPISSESGPAVGHGTVYIGCLNRLCALNAVTGTLRWAFAPRGCSLYSTPAVAGVTVYVGCYNHEVYALNAGTGQLRWSYKARSHVLATPRVMGGTVYVASRDGTLYALNTSTGHLQWSRHTGPLPSVSATSGALYVGSFNGTVSAFNAANGHRRWTFRAGESVQASPAVVGETVYFGSGTQVYALNAANGTSRWNQTAGLGINSGVTVTNGTVLVGSGDQLYALNAANGQHRWSYIIGSLVGTNPIAADGRVYVGGDAVYSLNITGR